MTDIHTRLAALTTKDKEGLLPCHCGHAASLQNVGDYLCYSVICSHENHHETRWYDTCEEAIAEWNNRPREAALISLVLHATKEIERLQNTTLPRESEDTHAPAKRE